jgi:hypothetical protein
MTFIVDERVKVDGLSEKEHTVGTIIDYYNSIKGQAIKVLFDSSNKALWVNCTDPNITVSVLE